MVRRLKQPQVLAYVHRVEASRQSIWSGFAGPDRIDPLVLTHKRSLFTRPDMNTAKNRARAVIAMVAVAVSGVAYLSLIGMDDRIEEHGGCIAVFRDADAAQRAARFSSTFSPLPNITIHLQGCFSGKGGLAEDEVQVYALMTGKHRRRLFDPRNYQPCSGSKMAACVRDEWRRLTGDATLALRYYEGVPSVFMSCE